MYISLSVENIITIGVMLMAWMFALHVIGQVGFVQLPTWLAR